MGLILPTKVEIKHIEGKGYGVFATEVITPGEIIEECHLIPIPPKDINNKEILPDYRFLYPRIKPEEFVIPFGFGCIYNHSHLNNADWRDHPTLKLFQFYAVKHIFPKQEICTYYGNVEYWEGLKDKNIKLI